MQHDPKRLKARSVDGPSDITTIQQLASRLWPLGWHPGGLGWALVRGELAEEVVLVDGPSGPAGWAALGVHEPGYLLTLADPSLPAAAEAIAAWVRDTARQPELKIEVADEDPILLPAICRAGFDAQQHGTVVGMRRPVLHTPVQPPDGYLVRAVRPEETEARVEVHRAAWRPAVLPYAELHRPTVDPDATSSFTLAVYEAVRRTWLYNRRFDLVAVAPDGSLAACCIAWYDPATGVAEIEPLGVSPDHRGRGLAGALCLEVAARVSDAGGHEVFINAEPRPEYPAPWQAYARVGFKVFDRAHAYVLRRSPG